MSGIVRQYVAEAVATFNDQHYLACAVLLGGAAEALLEQMYAALGPHLGSGEKHYTDTLKGKRWASQRFEYARSQMTPTSTRST
jgi:hypothetical protein